MKRKILLFVFIMLFPMLVHANTVINGNDFAVYQRSKQDIFNRWQIGKINRNVEIFTSLPSYEAPYKAGVVTDEYLAEAVDNLNYYRYLVGVPDVVTGITNDEELQTAEVIQTLFVSQHSAITHHLDEDFPKPNDMSSEFYNLGAYADHDIISYGRTDEPNFYFFDESIFDPRYPEAGHRMALLSPEVGREDYGIGLLTVYGRSTNNRTNYNNMTNSFAAYPSPGYFPKEDFADISDWDIFLNIDNFKFLTSEEQDNVRVTIKNLTTNEIYERSKTAGNLNFDYKCVGTSCTIYNRMNILQPDKNSGDYYEGSYKVTVQNLKDKSGNLVDLEYTVNFYDKLEAVSSNVVDVNYALTRVYLDGTYNEDLLHSALEDSFMILSLDNDNTYNYTPDSYDIEYSGVSYGMNVYSASTTGDNLPSYIHDPNNLISKEKLPIFSCYSANDYRMEYVDTNYSKVVGDDVVLQIDDVYIDEDGYISYGWVRKKDGEYIDLDPSRGYELNDFNLSINNLTKEDAGEYYFVVLLTTEESDMYYYISKPITLNISVPVENIEFEYETLNLHVGDVVNIYPIVTPANADYTLSWQNVNGNVASVDANGILTAKNVGSTRISVSAMSGDELLIDYIWINVTYMRGDMNKNGKIDLSDVITLLRKYLNDDATEEEVEIGDMDENENIGLKDIIILLRTYLEG